MERIESIVIVQAKTVNKIKNDNAEKTGADAARTRRPFYGRYVY